MPCGIGCKSTIRHISRLNCPSCCVGPTTNNGDRPLCPSKSGARQSSLPGYRSPSKPIRLKIPRKRSWRFLNCCRKKSPEARLRRCAERCPRNCGICGQSTTSPRDLSVDFRSGAKFRVPEPPFDCCYFCPTACLGATLILINDAFVREGEPMGECREEPHESPRCHGSTGHNGEA